MKLIRCLSLCLLAQFTLPGAGGAAEPVSAYQTAVNAYVEAVAQELLAFRTKADEVFKATAVEKREAFKGFFANLEKCEQIHQELKNATAKDFDLIKARYEKQRTETMKAWDKLEGR